MKKYLNPVKWLFFITIYLTLIQIMRGQAPTYQWKKQTWSNTIAGANNWNESGEQWWYSHKNLYGNGGGQTGYVACGYSTFTFSAPVASSIQTLFNEGANSCYNPVPSTTIFTYGFCDPTMYVPSQLSMFASRGTVAKINNSGDIVWEVALTFGEIQDLIVDGGYIYAIGQHNGAMDMGKNYFLSYNPDATNPSNTFDLSGSTFTSCGSPVAGSRIYIAKLDTTGSVIWENLYGNVTYSNAATAIASWEQGGVGYDILKNSVDGDLYATGYHQFMSGGNTILQGLMLKINPSNGYLIQKKLLPFTGQTNYFNDTCKWTVPHTICEIGTTGSMVVGSQAWYNFGAGTGPDQYRAMVHSITQSLTLSGSWNTNPVTFAPINTPTTGDNQCSNIYDINYHSAGSEILVAALHECTFCAYAGAQAAQGKIYRLDNTGAMVGGTNPLMMGLVNSFDLRLGVTETCDGGYAAVSSRSNTSYGNPSPTEYSTYTCLATNPGYWDTDPVIRKWDNNQNYEWEWSEHITVPVPSRATPMGNFKRQECMYKITQHLDAGLVVSGNSSHDNDDYYMVKLNPDQACPNRPAPTHINQFKNDDYLLSAHPNPFGNELSVKYQFEDPESNIQIIEPGLGRIVKDFVVGRMGQLLIKTEDIPPGVYIISAVRRNKPTTYIKIIKSN